MCLTYPPCFYIGHSFVYLGAPRNSKGRPVLDNYDDCEQDEPLRKFED